MERVALVTGGSSGIGLASARALNAQGINVSIVDLNDSGQTLAEAEGMHFVQADLSERNGCKRAVDSTVEAFGRLDILVNNAGFQHIDPIVDFPEDTWDKLLAVMLTAPFLLTKYAWNQLIQSGHGRVIHIGSAHSLVASPYKAAYVSAKHGLMGLTRVTALEGGEHGLTCNTICPAYVRTPLVDKQIADQARTRGISEDEVEQQVFLENVAIKRLLAPEDVGNYVTFLSSPEAWSITGSFQTMDLGWTAR
jgi:3-hydroxybutyrate dehydrogenase